MKSSNEFSKKSTRVVEHLSKAISRLSNIELQLDLHLDGLKHVAANCSGLTSLCSAVDLGNAPGDCVELAIPRTIQKIREERSARDLRSEL